MQQLDDIVFVGKIMRTRGLKGELVLWVNKNHFINQTLNGLKIFLQDAQAVHVELIKRSKFYKRDTWLINLKNYNHINQVANYVHCLVGFRSSDLQMFPKQQDFHNWSVYYHNQLVGHVVDVEDYGAHPLLRIQPSNLQQATWLIPWVNNYIADINHETKTFILNQLLN